MKKILISFLTVGAAFFLNACGNSGGGGGATPVTPYACPVGQVWNGAGCVIGGGITPNTTVQYYDYNRVFNAWGSVSANGDLVITHSGAYQAFLREAMGICDRSIWGWDSGLARCENWVSGSFQVSFSVNSGLTPSVKFEAAPAPSFFQYYINFGINAAGVAFNPLILTTNNTYSLINNSKGFEIRAQGSYWNGGGLRLIQIQVLQGTLNDGYFTYDLYYPYNNVATKFASGKFKRY